ncbi:MAG: GSU2086 family protein, partial [Planctomycetota bacterium]
MLNLSKVRTYPIAERKNLVTLTDLVRPEETRVVWEEEGLDRLCRLIHEAAQNGGTVLLQMGAHVIKCGMGLLIRDLMERGFVTHLAMNGACPIHDFEIALIGATSEDVAVGIEDGSFGMAEETGRFINETVNASTEGFGKALGRRISEEKLPHRDYSVLCAAFELGVPATVHVAIGTDIIHQHPTFDGAATGAAAHYDFRVYVETVSKLAGGVVLNFGSAVIMPEVFLKALSISRNLGF